jgi:hypothetical protein
MKLFDWLTGTKRPAAGVTAKTTAEVRADLLAVNRPTAPFVVRDGAPESVDLPLNGASSTRHGTRYSPRLGLRRSSRSCSSSMSKPAKSVQSIKSGRSSGAPAFRGCPWLRRHFADKPRKARSAWPSLLRSRVAMARFTATSSRPPKSKRRCRMR